MPLYERLMGIGDVVKIPVHQFQAAVGEFGRGRLTQAQAQAVIESVSGAPLAPDEVTDTQTLLNTVTGTATAKLARATEIDHVLMLAERRPPGYDTVAAVKTRLGV